MGILDGKVALITGAGGGLGRAYALMMAREGARVVVNDLGGARDGSGQDQAMADKVVDEIKAQGGEAVANYASVADAAGARSMVAQALEAFGRLDIVVNNAGILRDKTLINQTEEMWDLVMDVHLKGTFLVTQAAVKAMLKADTPGRIINTSSYAGLKGNFGQSNYGAAKAGIAGFTRVVALETRKYGITCNAIAPIAKTRMTEDISMVPSEFEPEDIAPLVTWLASDEAAEVTGRVFGAHGSHYFEYKVELTPGVDLGKERWTPTSVGARFAEIEATQKAEGGGAADEGLGGQVKALFAALPGVFKAEKAGDWAATIAFDVKDTGTFGLEIGGGKATFVDGAPEGADGKVVFDSADTLLQMAGGKLAPEQAFMSGKLSSNNMGVLMKFGKFFDLAKAARGEGGPAAAKAGGEEAGAQEAAPAASEGLNPGALGKKFKHSAHFIKAEDIIRYAEAVDDRNERYVDVERDGGIVAPPIFPVRPMFSVLSAAITDDELGADMLRLVHGEQDMRFYRPLKPWDLVAPRGEISSIEEKSSGYLFNVHQRLMCDGELVCEATSGLFVRKPGGSSKGGPKPEDVPVPQRQILYEEQQFVAPDQPRRYADASGDHNPIHVDPEIAKAAGLKTVILHGLCTMAFAARAVVNGLCDGDPTRLRRFKVRFSKPVYPESTLTTRIWKESEADGVVTLGLETVDQDGTIVLTNGLAEIEG